MNNDKDLLALKALAQAATPGPWAAGFPTINGNPIRQADCQVTYQGCLVANVSHGPIYPAEPFGSAIREANANFIAAANPQAILSLIARVEQQAARIAELERFEDQAIRDRDHYHEMADKLAEAIASHFGADIGEHSNTNCPWAEALEVIECAAPAAGQAGLAKLDIRYEFERWMSGRGEAANYIGDGLYSSGAVTDQAEAFAAGVEIATLAAPVAATEQATDELLADVISAKCAEVKALVGDPWGYRPTDAQRYQRLRALGVAPAGTKQLAAGTVLRFQNLDDFTDADIKAHPSRGEAKGQQTPALFSAREALQIIHDTFKRDLDQGYITKDKEFAVDIASKALEDQSCAHCKRLPGDPEYCDWSECPAGSAPLATPADAGAGLTDERIDGLILKSGVMDVSWPTQRQFHAFARSIEREVLARLSTPGAPAATAAPKVMFATKRLDTGEYGSWLHSSRDRAETHLKGNGPAAPKYEIVEMVELAATPAAQVTATECRACKGTGQSVDCGPDGTPAPCACMSCDGSGRVAAPVSAAPAANAAGRASQEQTDALRKLFHWVGILKEGKPVGTIHHAYLMSEMEAVRAAFNMPEGEQDGDN